ncbi:hypothetical protein [Microvirga massiliensis]|uniref:hypothetical protein n=1 Tax=Microvirga massiliensis TaxID=1033741 RepID=UPI00062BA0FA|nr:hypothetical protein [Microvirga massiliensis]
MITLALTRPDPFSTKAACAEGNDECPTRSHFRADAVQQNGSGSRFAPHPVARPVRTAAPTQFDPVIDRRTAAALDLVVPPGLLGRADELIE